MIWCPLIYHLNDLGNEKERKTGSFKCLEIAQKLAIHHYLYTNIRISTRKIAQCELSLKWREWKIIIPYVTLHPVQTIDSFYYQHLTWFTKAFQLKTSELFSIIQSDQIHIFILIETGKAWGLDAYTILTFHSNAVELIL